MGQEPHDDEGFQMSAFDANDYIDNPILNEILGWFEDEAHWRYKVRFDDLSDRCETASELALFAGLLIAQSETPMFSTAVVYPNKPIAFGYRPDFMLEAVGYQPLFLEMTFQQKEYKNLSKQRAVRKYQANVYEIENKQLTDASTIVKLAHMFLSDLFSIHRG